MFYAAPAVRELFGRTLAAALPPSLLGLRHILVKKLPEVQKYLFSYFFHSEMAFEYIIGFFSRGLRAVPQRMMPFSHEVHRSVVHCLDTWIWVRSGIYTKAVFARLNWVSKVHTRGQIHQIINFSAVIFQSGPRTAVL